MNPESNESVVIDTEEKAIADLNKKIENAQAMKRLLANDDFIKLFENGFIRDWAITQTNNISVYKPEVRVRVLEQMLARSVFKNYCEEILEVGRLALDTMQQIKEEEQASNIIDVEQD